MAFIQTVNLSQSYECNCIVKDINLSIDKGEALAVIGPTGAGKTTLLRMLDMLEKPYSGQLYFDGVEVTKSKRLQFQARRRMSYVHQKPMVFTTNVFNNVAQALRWRHIQKTAVRDKIEKVLELVGLANYENRDAKTLSGGETQRVAIARALVTEPEVLFLDEPTANLDPVSVMKIEEILMHIIREQKTTVVMATHDMLQGQRLAGRIGVLMKGEILQIGSPRDIFSTPANREVAEFVGVDNILGGVIVAKEDGLAAIQVNDCLIQAISDYGVGERVNALIRPEEITISLSRDVSSARNTFSGRITKMFSLGALVRIEVDCGFSLLSTVTKRSVEDLNLAIGKEVYATFKATAIHVIRS